MDILVYSIVVLQVSVVVAILFFGRRSGWFALLFAIFGVAAIEFSILTDLKGIIIALNSMSALMFLAWITVINRKKEGESNDSNNNK